ncbi:hypothetical protein F4557_000267 [Actinomadura catellatispora]|uniref:Uncharacterized protein n=1 Tax=Actinomadura livida TaxID=79909 RepID=A0A7W7I7E4_9ACTN|nr:hypothetical protein [Actinomadura catellatispora]
MYDMDLAKLSRRVIHLRTEQLRGRHDRITKGRRVAITWNEKNGGQKTSPPVALWRIDEPLFTIQWQLEAYVTPTHDRLRSYQTLWPEVVSIDRRASMTSSACPR